MPSVGVEFITQMGVYIPEFVVAAIEAHTSVYHESALNAKITMSNNQIKLSIPAPEGNIQLFSIGYKALHQHFYSPAPKHTLFNNILLVANLLNDVFL